MHLPGSVVQSVTAMKQPTPKASTRVEPVECLMGVFSARRDLLKPIREGVMKGADLSVDQADILVLLYGHRKFGWGDFPVGEEDFIPMQALREALVHEPGRFSRRVRELQDAGLVESLKESASPGGRRRYVQSLRITEKGITAIRQVYERYCKLASTLLAGVSQIDLDAHCRVNETISASIKAKSRNPWQGLTA